MVSWHSNADLDGQGDSNRADPMKPLIYVDRSLRALKTFV